MSKGDNKHLSRSVAHAGKIVRQLQGLAMSLRMVPFREAAKVRRFGSRQLESQSNIQPSWRDPIPCNSTYKVLAIGASLGGFEAIQKLLQGMPVNSPGIIITQHLPETFAEQFANRLNTHCNLDVQVAASGDQLIPGLVLVAPGDKHLMLCRKGSRYFTETRSGPLVHRHCPSINVLFHSVAASAGSAAVGILLTGMGSDGARGLLAMRQAGARTFVQDEESCVVFGMPKVAIALGAAEKVVPLSRMSEEVIAAISQQRGVSGESL